MVNPLKPIDFINDNSYQYKIEIVEKYTTIDGLWGINAVKLTDKEIDVIKNGKCLYFNDGEYAHILYFSEM